MAFDEALAQRVRDLLQSTPGLLEKKMFGGTGFLLRGNMACGVHGDSLIVRIPPEETGAALARPHVRVFDLTGRPMKGWILIDPPGLQTRSELAAWIQKGIDFALSLPAK